MGGNGNGSSPPLDQKKAFDEIWGRYPMKDGKEDALRHFKATVKTPGDLERINRALDNYLAHLGRYTWKNPKNGSTWFNQWRDFVDFKEPPSREEAAARAKAIEGLEAEIKALERELAATDGATYPRIVQSKKAERAALIERLKKLKGGNGNGAKKDQGTERKSQTNV